MIRHFVRTGTLRGAAAQVAIGLAVSTVWLSGCGRPSAKPKAAAVDACLTDFTVSQVTVSNDSSTQGTASIVARSQFSASDKTKRLALDPNQFGNLVATLEVEPAATFQLAGPLPKAGNAGQLQETFRIDFDSLRTAVIDNRLAALTGQSIRVVTVGAAPNEQTGTLKSFDATNVVLTPAASATAGSAAAPAAVTIARSSIAEITLPAGAIGNPPTACVAIERKSCPSPSQPKPTTPASAEVAVSYRQTVSSRWQLHYRVNLDQYKPKAPAGTMEMFAWIMNPTPLDWHCIDVQLQTDGASFIARQVSLPSKQGGTFKLEFDPAMYAAGTDPVTIKWYTDHLVFDASTQASKEPPYRAARLNARTDFRGLVPKAPVLIYVANSLVAQRTMPDALSPVDKQAGQPTVPALKQVGDPHAQQSPATGHPAASSADPLGEAFFAVTPELATTIEFSKSSTSLGQFKKVSGAVLSVSPAQVTSFKASGLKTSAQTVLILPPAPAKGWNLPKHAQFIVTSQSEKADVVALGGDRMVSLYRVSGDALRDLASDTARQQATEQIDAIAGQFEVPTALAVALRNLQTAYTLAFASQRNGVLASVLFGRMQELRTVIVDLDDIAKQLASLKAIGGDLSKVDMRLAGFTTQAIRLSRINHRLADLQSQISRGQDVPALILSSEWSIQDLVTNANHSVDRALAGVRPLIDALDDAVANVREALRLAQRLNVIADKLDLLSKYRDQIVELRQRIGDVEEASNPLLINTEDIRANQKVRKIAKELGDQRACLDRLLAHETLARAALEAVFDDPGIAAVSP